MSKEAPRVSKGIQFFAMSLPLFFLGPTVFNMALKNKEHPLFIPVLIFGGILLLGAIFFFVKALKQISKALFDKK